MYKHMYETHLFCILVRFSLLAAGLSSRSRLWGTQGARVYSRRKFGPRSGCVARGPGVQSRAIWQVITGLLSASPSRAGQWKLHKIFFALLLMLLLLWYHVCITPSLKLSSSLFCGSNGSTAVAHQAIPFVT